MGKEKQGDTIEVRPDERFDADALQDYLKGRLEDADKPLEVRQFGGGAANLTYLLDFAGREYVLRRPPLGPVAAKAHDMSREFKVLSVLYKAFPPAPRAHLLCEDEEVIGAPFFIMERRCGIVVRRRMPRFFRDVPGAGLRMTEALVDTLVDLHSVDYVALGLADLGRPEGFIERQVEGWYKRWTQARDQERPEMDALYRWLRQHLPSGRNGGERTGTESDPGGHPPANHANDHRPTRQGRGLERNQHDYSLLHNDYKLDNVMWAREDPGRVAAVFDWDMCTLGDPLSDLGALLAYWSQPDDPPALKAMAMMPSEGFPSRRDLVRRYCDRSGRSSSAVRFYHVLGLFRVAVIVAQIHIRYRRGQTQDERFAALAPLIPLLARRALDLIESA